MIYSSCFLWVAAHAIKKWNLYSNFCLDFSDKIIQLLKHCHKIVKKFWFSSPPLIQVLIHVWSQQNAYMKFQIMINVGWYHSSCFKNNSQRCFCVQYFRLLHRQWPCAAFLSLNVTSQTPREMCYRTGKSNLKKQKQAYKFNWKLFIALDICEVF